MLSRQRCLHRLTGCLNHSRRAAKHPNHQSRTLTNANSELNILKSPFKDIDVPKLTIPEYVWQNLHKWADKTAVVCGVSGRGYTYSQAFRLSNAFAANLRRKLRLQDGACVAVMLPNLPEYPLAALGVLQAGCVLTTINPIYTPHEIQRQLVMSSTKLVVTTADKAGVIREAMQMAKLDLPIVVVKPSGQSTPPGTILFSELAEDTAVDLDCLREVRRINTDIAVLPYSSGTTGMPKGVALEHTSIVANCEQVDEEAIRVQQETTASYQESVMGVLPFFHIYGMVVVMAHKLARGCKIVTLPGFTVDSYLDAMIRHRISAVYAAPPLVLFMATHPAVTAKHFEHLRVLMSGAAPLPTADIARTFEKAQREFSFMQGYGLTECSPVVSITTIEGKEYGTIGYPLPSTHIKIEGAGGEALGCGQEGEMLVRGPQVMRGYLDNDAANAEIFAAGGWLRTGDLASYGEDGTLVIRGRLKELIKVKGYQVPPAELEGLLREHPEVLDAAVVGAPHPQHGQVPRAFVVLRAGASVQPRQLRDYVAERVAPYKRIEHLQFVDSVPKNASGKIMRKELEKMELPSV